MHLTIIATSQCTVRQALTRQTAVAVRRHVNMAAAHVDGIARPFMTTIIALKVPVLNASSTKMMNAHLAATPQCPFTH
jgi:hypothetical protein